VIIVNEASEKTVIGIKRRMDESARVAVITGAAQGIGRRTAEVFAEQGYVLALNDLKSLDETANSVRRRGAQVLEFTGDISSEETVARFASFVQQHWGRTDVLVNNAGMSFIASAENVSVADFRRILDINLIGPFLLARAFGSMMLAQGRGSIVNIASIAGIVGIADRVAYNASKHGLIGLTRTLAAEWGGRGIRVNAVCPGWVKTEMDIADQATGNYSDADITDRVPMGRFASAEDVARGTAFLADQDLSGYINGHALVVDGGWTIDGSWESLRLRHRLQADP
jgi:NAD(P)-dependent dehydrogenase (short-subunit alcohol dehydrogenase family)